MQFIISAATATFAKCKSRLFYRKTGEQTRRGPVIAATKNDKVALGKNV